MAERNYTKTGIVPTDDIVTRLRAGDHLACSDSMHWSATQCDKCDAAGEIERLEQQVQMLAGLSRQLLRAGDDLHAAIRNHSLREEHLKTWEEARRG